jgi:N-acetylneuraminic acid mutarotase
VCAVNSYPLSGQQYYIATASAGDSVYVLENKYANPSTSSHKYSAATDVWTTIRKIPTWRAGTEHGASAATVGDRIYVVGGHTSYYSDSAKNEAYDTQTDTWATKAALPVGRAGAAIGVRANGIYVVAGYSLLSSMHVYTPSADAWTSGASRSDRRFCGSRSDRRFCGSSSDRRIFCSAVFILSHCGLQVRACPPPRGSLWPARSSATCCTLREAQPPRRR